MPLVMRNGGLVKLDDWGERVAYGYLEVYIGDNTVLRIEDDEAGGFETYELYMSEDKFRELIEMHKKSNDPFLFAGEYDSEALRELIETYKQINKLKSKLKELYYKVDGEIREILFRRERT